MDVLDDVDPERAWLATVGALVVAVVAGSLAFPRRVYGGFVWHYFWGPVYADAKNAECAVWADGARELLFQKAACATATEPVAYPGYTLVSEAGYMVLLLLALGGVILLLRRLDVGESFDLFFALLPFVFFGGALRTVEDANNKLGAEAALSIGYPWNSLLISPVIYVTVFALTVGALVGSIWLVRTGRASRYERPLFAVGTVLLVGCLGYLAALALTTEAVGFFPQVTILTVLIATLSTAAVWWFVREYAPEVAAGTGLVGAVVVWGHAIDGASNVLILDWANAIGLAGGYTPKHPVNQAVVDVTRSTLPASVVDAVGAAWPFLLLKLLVATAAVWLFNEEVYEESPRYTVLLLIAILAVGLGPGTRDMLRATFGV